MKPFRTPPAAIAEDGVRSPLVAEHFGQTTCTRSGQRSGAPCDGIGVGWHPGFRVVGRHATNDLARLWLPGHDSREPGVAPGAGTLAIIDPPAALSRGRPVAGATAAGEQRSDDGDKIRGWGRGRLRSGKPWAGQPRQQKPEGSEPREKSETARDHVETPGRPA